MTRLKLIGLLIVDLVLLFPLLLWPSLKLRIHNHIAAKILFG